MLESIANRFSPAAQSVLLWKKHLARPSQLPPEGYRKWLYQAGRGSGKTRSAAEKAKEVGLFTKKARIAIAAPTFSDGRDVCIEGESGLLEILPSGVVKNWNRSIGELRLKNGSYFRIITAERPRQGRGPQWNMVWGDEIAEWKYPETWHNLMLGLRLGKDPFACATGTPKPVKLIRELRADPDCIVTHDSTYANRANLAENLFREILNKYEGTDLGKQEVYGILLEELPNAQFKRAWIEEHRDQAPGPPLENFEKIVVVVDPQVEDEEEGSQTGIGVVGSIGDHAWVLADLTDYYTPNQWAKVAIDALEAYQGDTIIIEVNQGGAMARNTLTSVDPRVPIKSIRAMRSKTLRVQPVSSAYQQGRVHHVGMLSDLEDQMCNFISSSEAPLGTDRVDWLAYGVLYTIIKKGEPGRARGRKIVGGF